MTTSDVLLLLPPVLRILFPAAEEYLLLGEDVARLADA